MSDTKVKKLKKEENKYNIKFIISRFIHSIDSLATSLPIIIELLQSEAEKQGKKSRRIS
jgi:hypothetical protein